MKTNKIVLQCLIQKHFKEDEAEKKTTCLPHIGNITFIIDFKEEEEEEEATTNNLEIELMHRDTGLQ